MEEDYYTRGEKEFLLKVAYSALEQYVRHGEKFEPQTLNQKLWEKHGVFVSLHKNGRLRGCIGLLEGVESVILAVRDNAIAASCDPRFQPVEPSELLDINIEISILTEPEKIKFEDIKEGDGVIIKYGPYQATYLPQVWEEIKDRGLFFGSLCQKAGLDRKNYLDPKMEFFKYRAIVFNQDKL
ncbi:AmmeMemoRadiSam system protein A [Candidatus Falkowbacteria bacterium]|nr:AmmeMemoRadiSam system protein A [Candidatus Falkowbacteria bacterium]